jgi:ADP-ribosylglycohydrolase
MGHPTEFLNMAAIKQNYGLQGVQRFELWWDREAQRFAPYTDDTQMAEIVLRGLLSNSDGASLDAAMTGIASGFVEWEHNPQGGHRSPGNACLAGAHALAGGAHWAVAGGVKAGGCGSVMRAYPFGLLFAGDLEKAEHWAVEHSKLTHRDPIALAACAAMAVGVARTLRDDPAQQVLGAMTEAAARHDTGTAAMIERALHDAHAGVPPSVALDRLRGWAAHEAIAAAAYVVARHPADASAAILEGANTPGDSDSIATLAGALVGARTGLEGLPTDWVRDVERSSELRALAKAAAQATGLR